MATYVFSDVHGHNAPLQRALQRIDIQPEDAFFCLGDMIDRGPDPLGVIRTVRSLPHVSVLMGNHEELMLDFLLTHTDSLSLTNWTINGGQTTYEQIQKLPEDELRELLEWMHSLKRWDFTKVNGRYFLFAHAGIRPHKSAMPSTWTDDTVRSFMEAQDDADLTWIREDFWSHPTGLVGEDGKGPIVVSGHTPTPYLAVMTNELSRPVTAENGFAQTVQVGATPQTAQVPDRWDIDSGAAGGAGFGQVTITRLDDGFELAEPILDGE